MEYSEHSYHDVSTASMANSDVFTQSHVEHDNYKEPEPYVKQSKGNVLTVNNFFRMHFQLQ